jgi:hypothetical protein
MQVDIGITGLITINDSVIIKETVLFRDISIILI